MRNIRFFLAFLLLVSAILLTPTTSLAKPLQGWITTTASSVGYSHWDGGPHYAAFFIGDHGQNQHFLGTGGDAATAPYSGGIAAWHWYPPGWESRLLLPKTWLIVEAWRGTWAASNYRATVFR